MESGDRENLLVIGLVFTAEDFRKSLPPSCSEVLEQTIKKHKILLDQSDKRNVNKSPGPDSFHLRLPKELEGGLWSCGHNVRPVVIKQRWEEHGSWPA